jgi:uncharacterized protein (DUF1778 family)
VLTAKKPTSERIDVRVDVSAKRILQEAARASHKRISDYLLESGLAAAEHTLANRRVFALDQQQWNKFQAVLNRPVKKKPSLAKLMANKGVLDQDSA